jgi:hypothetical protein
MPITWSCSMEACTTARTQRITMLFQQLLLTYTYTPPHPSTQPSICRTRVRAGRETATMPG